MAMSTQRKGQIGINLAENIVIDQWKCRWQPVDAQNDDGIDALIFIEKSGEITGQIIYAQVKYMNAHLSKNGVYGLAIGKEKLARNAERWRRVVGAAIVIYINPKSKKAFWADLKHKSTIQSSQIFVSSSNRFDANAKNEIASLCGNVHRDLLAIKVETQASDFPHLTSKNFVQLASRELYKDLNATPAYLKDAKTKVNFTRSGWRHITRKGRAQLTRYQSFVLLGTIRKILSAADISDFRHHDSVAQPARTFVSIKAAVTFPFRQTGIVKIILEKMSHPAGVTYNFHTIYEPRRRRDVLGARRPLSQ